MLMIPPDGLRPRHHAVFKLMTRGLTSQQIATELGLSAGYVRRLLGEIRRFTGTKKTAELVWKLRPQERNQETLAALEKTAKPRTKRLKAQVADSAGDRERPWPIGRSDGSENPPFLLHAQADLAPAADTKRLMAALKRLGPRHRDILGYLIQGLTTKQIAQETALTEGYVGRLRAEIMQYTGTHNLNELLWAMNQSDISEATLSTALNNGSEDHELPAGTDGFVDPGNRDLPVLLRGKHRFQVPTIDQAYAALKKLKQLTPRQQEVIALYTEGLTASEIGDRLKISAQRVADIRQDAMLRLGTKTVVGLISTVTRLSIEASFAVEVMEAEAKMA